MPPRPLKEAHCDACNWKQKLTKAGVFRRHTNHITPYVTMPIVREGRCIGFQNALNVCSNSGKKPT